MGSSNDKYTDPELREEVKEEIKAGDKGGEPGQWSARKAQMMAKEYKERGGGYKTDKKDDKAKHLDQWTKEEWQTKDGDENARTEDGTHRYLPKKAWDKMTDEEKEATDKEKVKGSKAGDQYVGNTDKAKKARKEVSEEPEEEKSGNKKQSPVKKQKANDGTAVGKNGIQAAKKSEDDKDGDKQAGKKAKKSDKAASTKKDTKQPAKKQGTKKNAKKSEEEDEQEEEDGSDDGEQEESDEDEAEDKDDDAVEEEEDDGVDEDDLAEDDDEAEFNPDKADDE